MSRSKSCITWDSNDIMGMSPLFCILTYFINDVIEMVVLTSLLTASLKKAEEHKMSASNRKWSDEETIMAVVGGRVRRLVEAVRRIERGKVGRTPPNLEQAPNEQE